jgi:hypothetical protein
MSSDFKTYYSNGQMKMLDELRIKKLFGYTFENDNFSSLDEMKNYIRDFEPEYGIKLIKNNINKKLKFEDLTGLCDKISLNIIQVINDNWSESDDSIYNKCLYMTQEFYSVCSKEIVRENLQMGSLEDNFVCVEKYFRYMDEIKKNIADYYKKKIMPSVREYRKQFKGYATLHNCLSNDAGILGMDNYVQEDLRRLMKILEAE